MSASLLAGPLNSMQPIRSTAWACAVAVFGGAIRVGTPYPLRQPRRMHHRKFGPCESRPRRDARHGGDDGLRGQLPFCSTWLIYLSASPGCAWSSCRPWLGVLAAGIVGHARRDARRDLQFAARQLRRRRHRHDGVRRGSGLLPWQAVIQPALRNCRRSISALARASRFLAPCKSTLCS